MKHNLISGLSIFALFILFTGNLLSQSKTVIYSADKTLRQIAREYLNDSNLWEEILKVNGLKSITELKNGMVLTLPEDIVTKSEEEISKALNLIQAATTAGARIFTPSLINEAIELRNKAISERLVKNWQSSLDYAIQSQNISKKARTESINQNDVSVQAILSDRRGTVQDKREESLVWNDTPENSSLNENQKIRTLSESFAEISFKDESRLRLNSNSQAVIQKMRMNLIENKQESEVSLLEGDIYALLSGSPRRKMNIDVPGVDTEINSKKFWINRDANDIKVANYDGEIKLKTTESTLTLEKNKGTMLGPDGTPMKPTDLLPKTKLKFPDHNSVYYKSGKTNSVVFEWENIDGAVSYWLEIGYERSSFSKTVLSRPNIKENKIEISGFQVDGAYYWRIAAVDQYGFPGNSSDASLVKVITDTTKPYLYIHSPPENELFSESSIKISGETETDIELKINNNDVSLNEEGEFSIDSELTVGENIFNFSAKDKADNIYTLSRKVYYSPFEDVKTVITKSLPQSDNGKIEVPAAGGILSGSIIPKAKIKLFSPEKNFYAQSVADSSGNYSISIPDNFVNSNFSFKVEAENGVSDQKEFLIASEQQLPVLKLTNEIPAFSTQPNLDISLDLENVTLLEINEQLFEDLQDNVSSSISLKPGENLIKISGYNKWGDNSVLVKSVIFDQQAPEYISHTLSKKPSDDKRIAIILKFREDTKAARIAEYELNTGKNNYKGYLILDESNNLYKGELYLPEGNSYNIVFKSVTLKDIYGNTKTIEL
ncbi:MAG: hypothetical protein SCALA702_31030 [Melioribacteraceae bacterium]|nr:MAG: hypothetical protein SCALA702_31030 [Melioribacteraceae bacterium]